MLVSFIDDYSFMATVYLINKKTEVPGCFKHYRDSMPIDWKWSDQGGEYISKERRDFFRSVPFTKRQSLHTPVAE